MFEPLDLKRKKELDEWLSLLLVARHIRSICLHAKLTGPFIQQSCNNPFRVDFGGGVSVPRVVRGLATLG